jgi:hypothetical protein
MRPVPGEASYEKATRLATQYQQAPAPPGGATIKRHWIQRYSDLPAQEDRLFLVQSWDTASKGGPENDFSGARLGA